MLSEISDSTKQNNGCNSRTLSLPLRAVRSPEINGMPDYRIQKYDEYSRRYRDMYYLDNGIQLDYCIEDHEYTKWLDPAGVPCYVRDTVTA